MNPKYRYIRNIVFIVGYPIYMFAMLMVGIERVTTFQFLIVALIWIVVLLLMDFETEYWERGRK